MAADDLRARLRRLRRDEGSQVAGAGEGTALPVWLRARLEARGARSAADQVLDASRGGQTDVGDPAGLCEAEPGFAARETAHAPDHAHGGWCLAEVEAADPAAIALCARDADLSQIDLERAVYLDIETNGLAGGAGTFPFLVALGRFDAGGEFRLWQGFLRDPAEEPALLASVARRVGEAELVVSFFGKVFDRHRLEDKMRVHGIAPPFAGRPHLDLYHPLRNLYGPAFVDARLQTMERALCGVVREDDLPGSLAPAAWLDYLAGRAHRLEAVFRHNADDVLSLVVLAAHLGRTTVESRADGAPLGGPAYVRAAGLARAYRAARDRESERVWVERALERVPGDRELRLWRTDLLRLAREPAPALVEYEALATEADDALCARAWVEVAKLREHHARDVPGALEACRRARRAADRHVTGAARSRLEVELTRRETRLRLRAGEATNPSA